MSGAEEREQIPRVNSRAAVSRSVDLQRSAAVAMERDRPVSVFDILNRLLGVTRTMAPSTGIRGNTMQVVVTSASANILPADPGRRFMLIQNNHPTATVKISFGVDATLVTGVNLAANGGSLLIDSVNMPTCDVYAIGSAASNASVVVVVA